ncbi:dimethyl sulfoxide reductase anchor subunit [Yokenella regensburgei]|uniref:dimethyl sulfoxide reductase anchor subunit family protein n=1 Tax=Yokenella regensburgei TaxID=158877 RepID=UPI003F172772
MHELPLLIFTLLLQGAVGIMLFLSVALLKAAACPDYQASLARHFLPALMVACMAGGVGLLASVFHLGYPLNALNALCHIASSWLSREIVFATLFLASLGLCTLLALMFKRLWGWLIPLAALLGLVDVFCMSAIYMHASVVTWTHINTPLMFFGSVAIIGAVASTILIAGCRYTPAPLTRNLMRMAIALIGGAILVRLLGQPSYLEWLAQALQSDAVTFPHQPLVAFSSMSTLRLAAWCLSVLGALVFVVGALRASRKAIFIGGVLLIVAEVLLRLVFFSIQ